MEENTVFLRSESLKKKKCKKKQKNIKQKKNNFHLVHLKLPSSWAREALSPFCLQAACATQGRARVRPVALPAQVQNRPKTWLPTAPHSARGGEDGGVPGSHAFTCACMSRISRNEKMTIH